MCNSSSPFYLVDFEIKQDPIDEKRYDNWPSMPLNKSERSLY